MNNGARIITAIAVIATIVAVVEGVMLMQRPVEQAPQESVPATQARPADTEQAAAADVEVKYDVPVATGISSQENSSDSASVAGGETAAIDADPAREAGENISAANDAGVAVDVDEQLTPQERQEREQAAATAKMKEAMAQMMEQGFKQYIGRLQLNEAQQAAAAEPLARLHEQMLRNVQAPMDMVADIQQRVKQIREQGALAGQSPEQIEAQEKAEGRQFVVRMKEYVQQATNDMLATMEDIRPVLDATQRGTLDRMQEELRKQAEAQNKAMDAATETMQGN